MDVQGLRHLQALRSFIGNLVDQAERAGGCDCHKPPSLLLVGPPGAGKTYLVKQMSNVCEMPLYGVHTNQVKGAPAVRKLFDQARENYPSLVFMDDIDAIFANHDNDPCSQPGIQPIRDELFTQLGPRKLRIVDPKSSQNPTDSELGPDELSGRVNGVGGSRASSRTSTMSRPRPSAPPDEDDDIFDDVDSPYPDNNGIIVVAATSAPWMLYKDHELLSRFRGVYLVGLPDKQTRYTLLTSLFADLHHSLTDKDIMLVADKTEGFTPADLMVVVKTLTYRQFSFLLSLASAHTASGGSSSDVGSTGSQTPLSSEMSETASESDLDGLPESEGHLKRGVGTAAALAAAAAAAAAMSAKAASKENKTASPETKTAETAQSAPVQGGNAASGAVPKQSIGKKAAAAVGVVAAVAAAAAAVDSVAALGDEWSDDDDDDGDTPRHEVNKPQEAPTRVTEDLNTCSAPSSPNPYAISPDSALGLSKDEIKYTPDQPRSPQSETSGVVSSGSEISEENDESEVKEKENEENYKEGDKNELKNEDNEVKGDENELKKDENVEKLKESEENEEIGKENEVKKDENEKISEENEETDEDSEEERTRENDDKIKADNDSEHRNKESEVKNNENEPKINESEPKNNENEPKINESEPKNNENEPKIEEKDENEVKNKENEPKNIENEPKIEENSENDPENIADSVVNSENEEKEINNDENDMKNDENEGKDEHEREEVDFEEREVERASFENNTPDFEDNSENREVFEDDGENREVSEDITPVFEDSGPNFEASGPDFEASGPNFEENSENRPEFVDSGPDFVIDSENRPDFEASGPNFEENSENRPDFEDNIENQPEFEDSGPNFEDNSENRPDFEAMGHDFEASGPNFKDNDENRAEFEDSGPNFEDTGRDDEDKDSVGTETFELHYSEPPDPMRDDNYAIDSDSDDEGAVINPRERRRVAFSGLGGGMEPLTVDVGDCGPPNVSLSDLPPNITLARPPPNISLNSNLLNSNSLDLNLGNSNLLNSNSLDLNLGNSNLLNSNLGGSNSLNDLSGSMNNLPGRLSEDRGLNDGLADRLEDREGSSNAILLSLLSRPSPRRRTSERSERGERDQRDPYLDVNKTSTPIATMGSMSVTPPMTPEIERAPIDMPRTPTPTPSNASSNNGTIGSSGSGSGARASPASDTSERRKSKKGSSDSSFDHSDGQNVPSDISTATCNDTGETLECRTDSEERLRELDDDAPDRPTTPQYQRDDDEPHNAKAAAGLSSLLNLDDIGEFSIQLITLTDVLEVVGKGYRSVTDDEIKRYTDFMVWFSNVAKSACPHNNKHGCHKANAPHLDDISLDSTVYDTPSLAKKRKGPLRKLGKFLLKALMFILD